MKRQRGSAMVLVLIMTVAVTSVIVATGGLTENAINIATKKVTDRTAKYSIEGTDIKNLSAVKAGTVTPVSAFAVIDTTPSSDNVANVAVIDNASTLTGSIKQTGSYRARGVTYTITEVYGKRKMPKPNYYALFSNTAMSLSTTLITGSSGVNGDVCSNGSIGLSGTSNSIGGDLETTGSVTSSSLTVSETQWTSAPSVTFPSLSRSSYSSAAAQSYSGNQTFSNYTFSSAYRLVYINGNLTLSGTITGTGTLYVTGNVSISASTAYASSGARMAIISEGSVDVASGATSFVGYFYAPNNVRVRGVATHTLTRGGIAADSVTFDAPVTIVHDSAVWTDDTEGTRLKLPGYWP